jgi:hypothetical protein
MLRALVRRAAKPVNWALGTAGLKIVRARARYFAEYQDYIPLEPTMAAAKQMGLAVGDYIDAHHNAPGATQETIERLVTMGVLHPAVRRICEIGPGSGRYLHRVMAICKPDRYEIYETAKEWREYLARTYPVVVRAADGKSLSATPDRSIDLVHAHKVFTGTPFLIARGYLGEIARVVGPGGRAVFDFVTEACMDDDVVERWFASGGGYQAYPNMIPAQYVIELLQRKGFLLEGRFFEAMKPGKTECFIFRKRAVGEN